MNLTKWSNSGRQEVGWWSPETWGVAIGSCLLNGYRIQFYEGKKKKILSLVAHHVNVLNIKPST